MATDTELLTQQSLVPSGRWRHKRSGRHYYIHRGGILEWTLEPVVMYRSVDVDDSVAVYWVRPLSQFVEKFERVE